MFITFTREYKYLIDNIKNGFLFQNHKIEYKPSTEHTLSKLIPLWDEYKIKSPNKDFLVNLYKKHEGINSNFYNELSNKLSNSKAFGVNFLRDLVSYNCDFIGMKCFTEIRNNQKIHPQHTGFFGEYGILMKHEWMIKNGGSPVVYVDPSLQFSNLIGSTLSILQTLDDCTQHLAGFKSTYVHKEIFNVLAFVEVAAHSFEYEWRIVHPFDINKLNTEKEEKERRLPFTIKDVHSIFVPNIQEREKLEKDLTYQLKDIPNNEKPKILLTNNIILSDKDIENIDKILERNE
ncbi:hypothetical protein DAY19_08580 [Halobacteriovorax vibrionivorans]|uniref:Uncharacterized protein n=1 Tax=Halobacteriovorax vibrionivorans TaxID=2152716 RepID=A0ABY0IGM7_9BACT|nr:MULTISPECIES: abortive infection system antitoxin AbiGi family protein [Halobacteriovorax]RZF21735.1 hypothetical protein DAY19_08580 [Halobacteriovorax vibrionivorans]TGD45644.1 hypothetical protein EP118_15050 [Halobacteriovorax sp. Y22]